jgi:dTDP-4-dehydrorhamnose reductase
VISSPYVDKNPLKALEVNIIGTSNIVKLCMKFKSFLVYISTDYVFKGDEGFYSETDTVNPISKYGWSKLGGECAVRMHEKSLIVRTTFGPEPYPHEQAFKDQWTSKESVSIIIQKLTPLISNQISGVIHVGGPRRTLLEYAHTLNNGRDVKECSKKDFPLIPTDTSLNCERYNSISKI